MEQDLQFEQRKADIWVKARQEAHKAFVYYMARRKLLRSLEGELLYLRELRNKLKKALDSGDSGSDFNDRLRGFLNTFERRVDLFESIEQKQKLTREQAIQACEETFNRKTS